MVDFKKRLKKRLKKKYRIIIAGGRDFEDYQVMKSVILGLSDWRSKAGDLEFVSGHATGADQLGELVVGHEMGFKATQFRAKWTRPDGSTDRSAGHKRNAEMADYATHLIAFWNGESKGARGMIEVAKKKGLKIRVFNYKGERLREYE